MTDHTGLCTIGELAHRTGLSVRTIRFWSDSGLVVPAARSAGGYRLYDAAAVARLELVHTLRDLGFGLDTVQRILRRQDTVADVARTHAHALDAEIRTLRLRRAVLWSVAERGGSTEEMRLMHRLARLSAEERQRIIDDFVTETFAGTDAEAPGAGLAQAMRQMPARLPDDPTPEQVDAWVELAELVGDENFRSRVRQMAVAGTQGTGGQGSDAPQEVDFDEVQEHAGGALAAGTAPGSDESQAVLARIIAPGMSTADRARLADRLEEFTDRRVERYWQLMGTIHGRPPFAPRVPAFEWLIAALRTPA